jgi:hypothetical protein
LLLAADTHTSYLGVSKARRMETSGSPASLVSIFPFAFDSYAPLGGYLKAETPALSALVRYSAAPGLEPELKLTGVLKNQASGKEDLLPAAVRSGGEWQTTDKTVKTIVYLVEFRLPPQAATGAYTLKITAEEKKTRLQTEFSRDITID